MGTYLQGGPTANFDDYAKKGSITTEAWVAICHLLELFLSIGRQSHPTDFENKS
jgi:hypothetical protein